jgi:3-oxoadipate enol-lactonase
VSDLYVEQAGDGSPVVLLHEGIADSRMWDPQWAEWSKRFRMVRFDLRGFGQSPPAVGTFSFSGDLVRLLESLELGPVTLIGVSLGGAVAMETTIARPDLVSRLVVIAPGLRGYEMSDETKAGWEEEEMLQIADKLESEIPGARRETIHGAAHVPSMERPEEFDRIVLEFLS